MSPDEEKMLAEMEQHMYQDPATQSETEVDIEVGHNRRQALREMEAGRLAREAVEAGELDKELGHILDES